MESEVLGVDIGLLTAAHELKSPLSLIRQLALSLEVSPDPSKVSEQMVAISERALAQIDDLLAVARLENGLFELEPVNPRTICDTLVLPTCSVYYRNRSRLVVANHRLLSSIIGNFLTNAAKYGDSTTVTISDHAGSVRIAVRDYGPALPPDIWRTIQSGKLDAPIATPMRPGSSGLGLFISSRFARYMHAPLGAIRHRDGTSFYLDLPVSRQLQLC